MIKNDIYVVLSGENKDFCLSEAYKKFVFLLEEAKKDIKEKNARKLFDINKQWEKIAMFILNIAYDWNLEDLNLIQSNFPGIDLGDSERHIGVQVSTDSSPAKIKESLDKVRNIKINGRFIYEDYNNIYFFVPGEKQKSYRTVFDAGEDIFFTTDNIIDFETLKTIFCNLEDEKQTVILTILNRELFRKPKYQLSAAPITTCDFIEGSRKKEMEEIDKKFLKSNRVFLWGLGGIGKTELAAEWGMHKENVYLIHYRKSIMDTVLDMDFSGMQYIPSKTGMTDQQKRDEEFKQRLDILREYYGDATIIIDNFDDSKMTLAEMQNQSDYKALIKLKTRFIFTTRFMVRESSVHVTEMDVEDLLKIIKQNYDLFKDDSEVFESESISMGEYDEILRKLIMKVDRHTLTVDLMSKTLYESYGRLTPEKLLTAFEKNNIDDFNMPIITAYHNSKESDYELQERRMYEHLKILFDLAELDDIHKDVMRHAVLLPMAGMPLSMFRRCHTQEQQNALEAKIFHRSWLKVDRTHTNISIHSVIREVCKRELKPGDGNCKQFLRRLRRCVDINSDSQELLKPVADTMGHAAEFLPDRAGEWNHAAGNYYRLLGMYQKAIEYLKKASEIREKQKDAILADIYSDMGNTYTNLREYETGIEYQEKSLEICREVLEPDNKKITRRYNDMGLAYSYNAEKEQRRDWFEKAIKCYEKALEYYKAQTSPNMLHKSNVLNNMGNTYSNIGKTWRDSTNYQLALDYHMQAKDIRETTKNIPLKHLARSYKNIGNDYANLKMDDNALVYRKKALTVYEGILHDGHPELALAYQDVGNTCRLTGKYAEAVSYYKKAEKVWKKQLPQNYYDLAKCKYAIGISYSEQGMKGEENQDENALKYYLEALDCYGKDSKFHRKEVAKCKGSIGETYLKLGRRKEALFFLEERDKSVINNVKNGKLEQIKRYHHLGELCKKEKRFKEALEYYEKILEIREKNFLDDFVNLFETNFQIGCIYRDLRLPQEAMIYLEKSFAIYMEHFPEDKKQLRRIKKTIEITNGELRKCRKENAGIGGES